MTQRHKLTSEIGAFDIGELKHVSGRLKLAGKRTRLSLFSKEYLPHLLNPGTCILGSLNDLSKVSLLDCVSFGTKTQSNEDDRNYFTEVFPHFVLKGKKHLLPHEQLIISAQFILSDASALFCDFDAFGSVIDARPLIREVVDANANRIGRTIQIGESPLIQYFSGKIEVISTRTCLGKVSAIHSPVWNLGGPNGVRIKNNIRVVLEPPNALQFHDAISHIIDLANYFGVLIGRPQNLSNIQVRLKSDPNDLISLDVFWSWQPNHKISTRESKPHSSDVLISPIHAPEEFNNVLVNWLDRKESWHNARYRFFGLFSKKSNYDIDRLIGAANMFDILPSTAIPVDITLSEQLTNARDECRSIFRKLPPSPERNSVLGVLGRVGKSSLKRKIQYRAQLVLDRSSKFFPDLLKVVDAAVDCRNYYVHGSEGSFDYDQNFDVVQFFTDTLEFVFAASDLVEAGWQMSGWLNTPTSMSHPFGRYRVTYGFGLQKLFSVLPRQE